MKKKIFITGGGGMLASEIEAFYTQKGHTVIAPTHAQLDVADFSSLQKAFIEAKPEFVFHTAAMHVNACEENPQEAFAINSLASRTIARMCEKINATLIYISSCGLFGDEIKYYTENDPVVLKTAYARSKYEGETVSLGECKKTFAIRPGWLFGGSSSHKKNFVFQRFKEAQQTQQIKSASDKFGCPTYTSDLMKKIDELIPTQQYGVFHITNSGGCSRYDYIKDIITSFGLKTEIIPVDSSYFPRKANVPNSELLENLNLKVNNLKLLPAWQDAIDRYVHVLQKEL